MSLAIFPMMGRAIINPKAEQTLEDDGKLIVLGDTQALTELQRMFLAKSS